MQVTLYSFTPSRLSYFSMIIRSVRHKGLKRLVEDGDRSGVPADVAAKLRRILSFLAQIRREDEFHLTASWKAHQLGGERKGVWSLHVTKNWRITFSVDQDAIEIIDLNFEDYH